MILLKPSPESAADFLRRRKDAPLSYDFAGLTREISSEAAGDGSLWRGSLLHNGKASHAKDSRPLTPAGFVLDHRREVIGHGDFAWQRAREAIDRWVMFDNGWTTLHAPDGPPRTGNLVAMQVWIAGFWWLNPCRVLYEIDETAPIKRYGFGYGTLIDHAERGEERFMVGQDADGTVWYDLASFSRPRQLLARIFYPLTRRIQLKFGPDSMRAMRRFIADSTR